MIQMHKIAGFTFIEMILTLILISILGAVIVEVIAGPIQAYFWVADRSLKFENTELGLENMADEIKNAFVPSITFDETKDEKHFTFRKVLYKGIFLPQADEQRASFSIGKQLVHEASYGKFFDVYFPVLSKDKTQLYRTRLDETSGKLIVEDNTSIPLRTPALFYLLSDPIRYICGKNSSLLERIDLVTQDKSLLGYQIKNCEFNLFQRGTQQGILIALEVGLATEKKSLKMIEPIFFENRNGKTEY